MKLSKKLSEKLHHYARKFASLDAKRNRLLDNNEFDQKDWDGLDDSLEKSRFAFWRKRASQDKRWAEKDKELSDKEKIYYQGQNRPTKSDIKNKTDQHPDNLKLRPKRPFIK